jgi:hypothetical protein
MRLHQAGLCAEGTLAWLCEIDLEVDEKLHLSGEDQICFDA